MQSVWLTCPSAFHCVDNIDDLVALLIPPAFRCPGHGASWANAQFVNIDTQAFFDATVFFVLMRSLELSHTDTFVFHVTPVTLL